MAYDTNLAQSIINRPNTRVGSVTTPSGISGAKVQRPGNWLTHLLPIAGATLATLAAPETGGLSLAAIPAAMGLGAAGAATGKVVENLAETGKKNLFAGVGQQALTGGVAGGAGELLAPVTGKLVGGASDFLNKLLGKGGAEAATTAGADVAGKAATQDITGAATEPLATKTAADMSKGDLLRAGVRNYEAVVPKEPAFMGIPTADASAELNQWADAQGLKGSAKQQLTKVADVLNTSKAKVASALANDTTQPFSSEELKQTIAKAVEKHPLYPASITGDSATGSAFDKSIGNMNNIVDKMAKNNGDSFNLADVNTLRKQIDKSIKFKASPDGPSAINNDVGKLARNSLNETIKQNPEVAAALHDQHFGLVTQKALRQAGQGSGQGGVMVGMSGPRVRLPVGGMIQKGQDFLGRGLQEVAADPVKALFQRALPQAAGQSIANSGDQAQAATLGQQRFDEQSSMIKDLAAKQQQDHANSPLGQLDIDKVEAGMAQALQAGDTKTYTHLNQLHGLIQKAQQENSLPTAAVSAIGTSQDGLAALQAIADGYSSGKNVDELAGQASKIIAKASGQSGKPLLALLPTRIDKPEVVQHKLSQLRDLIHNQTEQAVEDAQDKAKQSTDQMSWLSSLLGDNAGATQ